MTSIYCVSFRIADKVLNGKSYEERRQMLINNIHTENCGYWEDTTSFFLITSELNTDEFAAKACMGLSATEDMVFIFDPSDMSASYFGAAKHPDVLRSFFPKLKNAP